ncbi:MAG: hypothetical protein JST80_07585 [Bdellovibrionales bacterium]|nr:hypothetical protein [Bdellovibrionales bacterium]
MWLGIFALLLAAQSSLAGNVIFITLDGVRPEDARRAFKNSTPYTYNVQVANTSAMSLPGYLTLHSGVSETVCEHNGGEGCENIIRETMIDKFIDGGMPLDRIAAFASWDGLNYVIESKPRVLRSINGIMSGAVDTLSPELRAALDAINEQAKADRPEWKNAVKDDYTWTMGMEYFKAHRPQFLYISQLDTDEWAHAWKRKKYKAALRTARDRIADLRDQLATMGEYGADTSIVVTTDHGRGRWPFFPGHGKGLKHSWSAWALVFPSENQLASRSDELDDTDIETQLDIRPLIEKLITE